MLLEADSAGRGQIGLSEVKSAWRRRIAARKAQINVEATTGIEPV